MELGSEFPVPVYGSLEYLKLKMYVANIKDIMGKVDPDYVKNVTLYGVTECMSHIERLNEAKRLHGLSTMSPDQIEEIVMEDEFITRARGIHGEPGVEVFVVGMAQRGSINALRLGNLLKQTSELSNLPEVSRMIYLQEIKESIFKYECTYLNWHSIADRLFRF